MAQHEYVVAIVSNEMVAVEIYYFYSGPASFAYGVPPFDAEVLASGLAFAYDSPDSLSATVFVPGHRELAVDVRWSTSPAADETVMVRDLISSLSYAGEARTIDLAEWIEPTARPCAKSTLVGQLARGDLGGLQLVQPGGETWRLGWPAGWSAGIGDHGRAQIQDLGGNVLAREWDEVELAVRSQMDSTANVCTVGTRLSRAFGAT